MQDSTGLTYSNSCTKKETRNGGVAELGAHAYRREQALLKNNMRNMRLTILCTVYLEVFVINCGTCV
jgi:hypothetical protein